jgi:hypothetical protein
MPDSRKAFRRFFFCAFRRFFFCAKATSEGFSFVRSEGFCFVRKRLQKVFLLCVQKVFVLCETVCHVFFFQQFFSARFFSADYFTCGLSLGPTFKSDPITHVSAIPTIAAFLCAENRNSSVRRFSGAARPRGGGWPVVCNPADGRESKYELVSPWGRGLSNSCSGSYSF